jgi:hypothetical protein
MQKALDSFINNTMFAEFDCPRSGEASPQYTLEDLADVVLLSLCTWRLPLHSNPRPNGGSLYMYRTQALMLKLDHSSPFEAYERVGIVLMPFKLDNVKLPWEERQLYLV